MGGERENIGKLSLLEVMGRCQCVVVQGFRPHF